jgi:hypothetical protein
MRAFTVLSFVLFACGHEQLDFHVPDGGHLRRDSGMPVASPAVCASASPDCAASFGMPVLGPGTPGTGAYNDGGIAHDEAGDSANGASSMAAGTDPRSASGENTEPQDRYQDDPAGYPAGPDQSAASCAQSQGIAEICANDLDDDCDGTVDEYPGIGEPCRAGCGEGIYVCSAATNSLLCHGPHGCSNPVPPSCGDGFVGSDEACDPNAQGEQPGVTCTLTCERPLFIRCVDSGVANPELCDELHVCDAHIGACMPVIGPRQPRCPQLPIEGDATEGQFYPMLEMENGECWITCSESEQCPSSLSQCYMGFCAVPF